MIPVMPDHAVPLLKEDAIAAARAAITDATLRRVFDYWRAKIRDGRLPARMDIDPLDLPFVMGNMILVDVERDPWRFRYRLAGSKVTNRLGFDPTGKYVDEHPDPNHRQSIQAVYTEVAATGLPQAYARNQFVDNRLRRYDVLVVPLSGEAGQVTMIMAVMKFPE
jgi:hypothetical protein